MNVFISATVYMQILEVKGSWTNSWWCYVLPMLVTTGIFLITNLCMSLTL